VTHELLGLSVELLEFAPIPGLQAAAQTLLNIWDAVVRVDVSFFFFFFCVGGIDDEDDV
jgi:abelson tyrosine-protein kinase 1